MLTFWIGLFMPIYFFKTNKTNYDLFTQEKGIFCMIYLKDHLVLADSWINCKVNTVNPPIQKKKKIIETIYK